MKKIIFSLLIFSAVECEKNPEKFVNDEVNAKGKTVSDDSVISKTKITKDQALKKVNEDIIQTLKDQDFKKFAEFIHPEKGADAKAAMLARDAALKAGDLAAFATADQQLTDAVNKLIQLQGNANTPGK